MRYIVYVMIGLGFATADDIQRGHRHDKFTLEGFGNILIWPALVAGRLTMVYLPLTNSEDKQ